MKGLSFRSQLLIRPGPSYRSVAIFGRIPVSARLYSTEKSPNSDIAAGKSGNEPSTSEDNTQSPAHGPVLNLDSIFVVSLPITTHRSFIYCHQKSSLLSTKQRNTIPWVLKAETKLVGLATKAWNKMNESNISINKKIVIFVRKLLDSIPYNESCLRSFPRKSTMIRETNEDHQHELPKVVLTSEVENKTVALDQIKPVPVYHPQFQSPDAILQQMHYFKQSLVGHHTKWAILCAIGLPLSLPVALIPVVPNVPGLYLAYRLYCHLQALNGAKNLGFLLQTTNPDNVDSGHLSFQGISALDIPYSIEKDTISEKERLLITPEAVELMVKSTGLAEIRDDLHRAYKQERKRLERETTKKTE